PSSARSGSRARVSSTAPAVMRLRPHHDRSVPDAQPGLGAWEVRVGEKNRPDNQFRTTTSPLVVRHRINWPVSGGPEPPRDQPRIQAVSRERASGGSCEASRSPFGGETILPRAKRPSPVGWLLIGWQRPELYSFCHFSGLLFFCSYLQITESYQSKPNAREVFTRITASISS